MNISFSTYTQFKSKVDKLGLCGWGMHRAMKRVLQDTDLKNPGWPRPKKDKSNKEHVSRPKPQAKDQDQRQSQRPKSDQSRNITSKTKVIRRTRTKTKDKG